MFGSVLPTAALLLATTLASPLTEKRSLNKPLIQPPIPSLDQGLFSNLRPTQSTHTKWEWGYIPDRCHDVAINRGLSPYDVEVYNVQYTDCQDIWIFCRHHDGPQPIISMIDVFGRMPVGMRTQVRTLLAFPGTREGYTYSDYGDVVLVGDAHKYPTLYAHEIGHSLDHNAIPGNWPSGDFSRSTIWENAYTRDQAISDGYAQNNQQENWAQEVVIALFNNVVPGGIGSVEPNWGAIINQYSTAKNYLGNTIIPGGTCGKRFPNAKIVCMGSAATSCHLSKVSDASRMLNATIDSGNTRPEPENPREGHSTVFTGPK